jgi:hypothetical protein
LAALARPRQGAIRAIDAEALAWSQPAPPAGRPPAGCAVPASSGTWRGQPLSA